MRTGKGGNDKNAIRTHFPGKTPIPTIVINSRIFVCYNDAMYVGRVTKPYLLDTDFCGDCNDVAALALLCGAAAERKPCT